MIKILLLFFRIQASLYFRIAGNLKRFSRMYFLYKYPKLIRCEVEKCFKVQVAFHEIMKWPEVKIPVNKNLQNENLKICHSGHVFDYSRDLFEKSFFDPEISFYVNRFTWILTGLNFSSNPETIKSYFNAILDWATLDKKGSSKIANDAYSISERLTNWAIFFILKIREININESEIGIIEKSILKQVQILLRNLEYWGPYTNNHLLSNGRALYILGRIFNISEMTKLGQEIIVDYSKILFQSGFVQEDSTHYQLIVTRWIIEIFSIAKFTNDIMFCEKIQNNVIDALQVCNTIFSEYSERIPLIGDISPDLSPVYFSGFPYQSGSKKKAPIHLLPDKITGFNLLLKNSKKIASGGNFNKWSKLSSGKTEIWVVRKNNGILSHGHIDNGSLCLFYSGVPVVTDPGCINYLQNDSVRNSQINTSGHFSLLMSNKPMDVKIPVRFHKNKTLSSKIGFYKSKDIIVYKLFSFDGRFHLKRKISIENSSVIVTDSFEIFKDDFYSSSFCLNTGVEKLSQNGTNLCYDENNIKVNIEIINAQDILVKEIILSNDYGTGIKGSLVQVKSFAGKAGFVKFRFSFIE